MKIYAGVTQYLHLRLPEPLEGWCERIRSNCVAIPLQNVGPGALSGAPVVEIRKK